MSLGLKGLIQIILETSVEGTNNCFKTAINRRFQVAFHLCFKARSSVKPFIWKLVLFTCKGTKMCK